MNFSNAVVLVDRHTAQIIQFDAESSVEQKLHEHVHLTHQHASGVRSEHEFFGQVCDALEGVIQVLVTGGHQGLAEFRNSVDKHRPQTAKHIVAYEVVDHPSANELLALARKHFLQAGLMQGTEFST